MNDFPQGSLWRKWDLHVHTPASVLLNNFGDDWDQYVQTLFRTLIEKEIAVVGITDYFSIDGYRRIKTEYLDNKEKLAELFRHDEIEKIKSILVLPNIEFRANIFVAGNNSVNFHVLLSDKIPIADIQEKFLEEVKFLYQGDPTEPDKWRSLREVNIAELGARLKKEHGEFRGSDLFVGMQNAVVDHAQVTEILKQKEGTFGEKYLFVTVADEDLSNISWDGRDHQTRKILIQKAHFLFAANPKTRDWALGKPPYSDGPDKFSEEFKTLKPSIHGSDAHSFEFIAHPCTKSSKESHNCSTNSEQCDLRFCWVKADPTFEGLRQVLYEPEQRVCIQSENPTPIKSSQTIKSIELGAATLDPELEFERTVIPFNEGLLRSPEARVVEKRH